MHILLNMLLKRNKTISLKTENIARMFQSEIVHEFISHLLLLIFIVCSILDQPGSPHASKAFASILILYVIKNFILNKGTHGDLTQRT